jgi:nitrite reductase (NADH) small subunit
VDEAPTKATLVDVCALDELRDGMANIVSAGDRELALVVWRDRVYALGNICPHMSASFEGANRVIARGGSAAVGLVTGGQAVGEFQTRDDVPVIQCPWHGWKYRLEDGACVADPRLRARSYPVVVRDGHVFVDLT